MLELRPNCEYCDRDLPPDSTQARICSYECTYCANCVETHLSNVCPNCGGGFAPRPIRPAQEHRRGVSTRFQKPSDQRREMSWDRDEVMVFALQLKDIAPEDR